MAVNSVTVIGNLGGDPQTRSLPSGDSVANFSLATTERFKDRNGARQERTEWHRIVAFGKLAETCAQYLSKGRQVYVEGRLTTREFEVKDGSGKRYRTEIAPGKFGFSDSVVVGRADAFKRNPVLTGA
jgi:single-strand DNA-binding protein